MTATDTLLPGSRVDGGRRVDVDLLVVGAGPAGLYAAYYAGFRGLRVAIVDSLPEPGGQVTALYPEKMIFDIAGYPSVRGKDLVGNLVAQAAPFSPTYLLGEQAVAYEHTGDAVLITTASGTVVRAKAVVVTGGIGTFNPRPLPGGAEWEGRGLSYIVPSYAPYQDKEVVVVGGGDSALDWALGLEPVARSVTLVHRRDAFRAHAHSVKLLRDSTVSLCIPAQVVGLSGGERLESVRVRNTDTKDVVLYFFFTNYGPNWKVPLHRPLPSEIYIDLGQHQVERVQVRKR